MEKRISSLHIITFPLLFFLLISCHVDKIEYKGGQDYSIDTPKGYTLTKSDSILIHSIGIDSFNILRQEIDSLGQNAFPNSIKIGPRIIDSSTPPNE